MTVTESWDHLFERAAAYRATEDDVSAALTAVRGEGDVDRA